MTKEELLKPRYKVIADYPGCPYEKGTILIPDEKGELYSVEHGYSWSHVKIMQNDARKFSHLIKKVDWYEGRELADLPKYLQANQSWGSIKQYSIQEVKHYSGKGIYDHVRLINGQASYLGYFLPATEEEYLEYQKTIL